MKKLGMLLGLIIFGAPTLVAGSPPGQSPLKADQAIWVGESRGFKIVWTEADIKVHSLEFPNRIVFSARSLANQEFSRIKASEIKYGFKERYCEVVCSYKILAVAGPILSFFEGEDIDCEKTAHPSATNRFTTIDLKKPADVSKKRVKLTDYFPEQAIYQALLADPRVRQALAGREPPLPPSPQSLAELYASLKDAPLEDGECNYGLPKDFLTRFAFHHLAGDKVAVRLALPYWGEVCRGQYLELELLLPVPEILRESLALAQTGKAGFLMQDQERRSGGRDTSIRFTKGKRKPEAE